MHPELATVILLVVTRLYTIHRKVLCFRLQLYSERFFYKGLVSIFVCTIMKFYQNY